MPTAQELYASTVRNLSPVERLRLAALILDDLTKWEPSTPDYDDEWSEEDMNDLVTFSLRHAAGTHMEEDPV